MHGTSKTDKKFSSYYFAKVCKVPGIETDTKNHKTASKLNCILLFHANSLREKRVKNVLCDKVKKGKHCITYNATIDSNKIKLGQQFICKDIPIVGGQNSPMSGCFKACMSAHFPRVNMGYTDQMTHQVPNGVADSIKFQLTSITPQD